MKEKSLNSYLSYYKKALKQGDIQAAYSGLVKYVQTLRTEFSKSLNKDFAVGNVLQGYMDVTYFYISNTYLKSKKLKLALVLNHEKANFELWLIGQTKDIQEKYWNMLKSTKWVKTKAMPQYSVFSVLLIKKSNFNNLEQLTEELKNQFLSVSKEIVTTLKSVP